MHPDKIAVACRFALGAVVLVAAGCATTTGGPVADTTGSADAHYEDPTARTLYAMARVLDSQGKQNQAESVLVRLLKEYPRFVPPYSDLAAARVRQGRLNEALSLLQSASKMAPDDPVLLNNTGVCLLMMRDTEAALKCFEKAIARGGQAAKYRANQALALGILRRDAESLEVYEAVVTETESRHNLEVIQALRGDKPDQDAAAENSQRDAAQQEAERLAAEEAQRIAAQQEAERLAAEEAQRIAAQQEAERMAAEEAQRIAAQQEAERLAAEEAARIAAQQEAERLAAEETARIAAQQEAERLAAEEAERDEAARLAARQVAQELAAQADAERYGDAARDTEDKDAGAAKAPAPEEPAQPTASADAPESIEAMPKMAVVDAQPLR